MKSDEIFKIIVDHPNYMISSHGRILNFKRERYLKLSTSKKGYQFTNIAGKYHLVHRLVAIHFLSNPLCLETVDHIDEDKSNNDISNLEWMTRESNARKSRVGCYLFVSPTGVLTNVINLRQFCLENNLTNSSMHKVYTCVNKHHKGWTIPTNKE